MEKSIRVTMFGKFSVQIGDKTLDGASMRSSQLEKLLAYLLLYRNKKITVQEYMEVLWEDEIDNPTGALKNLVYRLRKILKDSSEDNFIKTGNGSYYWASDLPVIVDAEIFEAKSKEARAFRGSVAEKIDLYEDALAMYNGKFLEEFSYEPWVISLSTYYLSLYLSMAKELAALYEQIKEYLKMQNLMKDALAHDNLDEELHYWNIKSLAYQNKIQMALSYYEEASQILYKNLGIRDLQKLKTVYKEIASMSKYEEKVNVDQVCEHIQEAEPLAGAYLCDYNVFKEIYRLEARRISRLGVSEYVLLLTLQPVWSDLQGKTESSKDTEVVMDILKDVLCKSLRIGDVAAKCSSIQYIVLLQTCTYETGTKVAERIAEKFNSRMDKKHIRLSYDIKEMEIQTLFPEKEKQ